MGLCPEWGHYEALPKLKTKELIGNATCLNCQIYELGLKGDSKGASHCQAQQLANAKGRCPGTSRKK